MNYRRTRVPAQHLRSLNDSLYIQALRRSQLLLRAGYFDWRSGKPKRPKCDRTTMDGKTTRLDDVISLRLYNADTDEEKALTTGSGALSCSRP